MELLKTALRRTIKNQAWKVTLQTGSAAVIENDGGRSEVALDREVTDLEPVFEFLFPKDRDLLSSGKPVQGALKVPGIGTIQVIAQYPTQIHLFIPPRGDEAFRRDWDELNSIRVTDVRVDQPNTTSDSFAQAVQVQESAPVPVQEVTNSWQPAIASPDFKPASPFDLPPKAANSRFDSVNLSMPPTTFTPAVNTTPQVAPQVVSPPPRSIEPTPLKELAPESFQGFVPQVLKPEATNATRTQQTTPDFDRLAQSAGEVPRVKAPGSAFGAANTPGQTVVVNFGNNHDVSGFVSQGFNAIDEMLRDMVNRKASDLHLTAQQPVCFRIDGDIVRVQGTMIDTNQMANLLGPIIPKFNAEEMQRLNDTDFAYEVAELGRFRCNVFRDRLGVGAVIRHVPAEILPMDKIGLPPIVHDLCRLNKGLVLVTGPTGSGKSTSLAAMIHEINRTRSDHVITIEDPIEFVHPQAKCLVNQREVHRHTSSFARALRAALREDPDVILIGELRDLETIAIAVETAETGHLVFGTLHTTSATSTVDRIVDQFAAEQQEQIRQMLAGSLKGVISQILLKKKSGGRVAVHEVLIVNEAVSAMIREGKTHMLANHIQTQKAAGNQLMNEAIFKLVKDDIVNPLEAYAKSPDKKALGDMLRRAGFQLKFDGAPAQPGAKNVRPAS